MRSRVMGPAATRRRTGLGRPSSLLFRAVFTKSLRDYRWAILGWGMGMGLVVYVQYALFKSTLGGASPAQVQQLVQQFQFFGEAVKVATPGGFVTFKIMGILPAIVGIWTVLAGARMTRGEEESGVLDILLSTPQTRHSVIVQKTLALATATALISLLIALWILAGMGAAGTKVDLFGALLAGADTGVTALLFGALALLFAQFVSRAAAAGWAGGLMAFGYVLDGTGRAVHAAAGLRPLSAFYYYDQNLPLIPGYPRSWGALALVLGLVVLASTVAALLFLERDVDRSVLADVTLGRQRVVSGEEVLARERRDVWFRDVGLHAIRRQSVATFWWVVSLALYAGYVVAVARSSEKQLEQLIGSSPLFKQVFSGANIGTNDGFVSTLVFTYMPLLIAIFAGIIAARWAGDLDTGRLELVLGTPQPRARVSLERYAAVVVSVVAAALGIWLAIVLVAGRIGFSLDSGHVAAASIGLLPLALITASLVFALAGVVPRGAVLGIMAIFLGVSFLTDLLRTLLELPSWVVNLSMFHQYDTPMLNGLNWTAFGVMLLVAAAVLALGTLRFSRADIDRGTAS